MSVESDIQKIAVVLTKLPQAAKAVQLFLDKVESGESLESALLKTAEIVALETAL